MMQVVENMLKSKKYLIFFLLNILNWIVLGLYYVSERGSLSIFMMGSTLSGIVMLTYGYYFVPSLIICTITIIVVSYMVLKKRICSIVLPIVIINSIVFVQITIKEAIFLFGR